MKRWIHAATKKSTITLNEFCSEVNEILNKKLSNEYDFTLVINNVSNSKVDFNLSVPYDIIVSSDICYLKGEYNDTLRSYASNKDAEGAASYIIDLIEKGVKANQIVIPSNYAAFLEGYATYFDAIADVVADVATQYDSDMQYDWRSGRRARSLIDWIINYDAIYFDEYNLSASYALGMTVTSYRANDFPKTYETADGTSVSAPSGIYYNGNSIIPKLKYFDADLKRLRIAIEDYFKDLEYNRDTGSSYGRNTYYEDSYPEREEERRAREAAEKQSKPSSANWKSIVRSLNQDIEDGTKNPLYDQTEAGEYILSICREVEGKLNLFVEPSIQGGQGGVWIYDESNDNEPILEGYDFATFDEEVIGLALQSKNMSQFKAAYENYLLSIIS